MCYSSPVHCSISSCTGDMAAMSSNLSKVRSRLAHRTTPNDIPMGEGPAYGLWSLVLINFVVFILFAFSLTRPRTTCDWRSLCTFSAFT